MLNHEIIEKNGYQLIRLIDKIKFEDELLEIKTLTQQCLEKGHTKIAFSIPAGSFLNSIAVGKFIESYHLVHKINGEFAIINPSPDQLQTMKIFALSKLVSFYQTEDELGN